MPTLANVLRSRRTQATAPDHSTPAAQAAPNATDQILYWSHVADHANYVLGIDSGSMASISLQQMSALASMAGMSSSSVAVADGPVTPEPSRDILQRVKVDVRNLDLTNPRQKLAADAEALLGYSPLRRELRNPGLLKQVLAKLEIPILDEHSVNRYKSEMVDHFRTANKMPDPTWRLFPLRSYSSPIPEFVLQKAVEIKRELPDARFYVDQLAVDPFLIVSMTTLPDYVSNIVRALDPDLSAYIDCWAEPKFEASM